MESTKLWKDTEKMLEEELPKIMEKLQDVYPTTDEFEPFYQSLFKKLLGFSMGYIISDRREEEYREAIEIQLPEVAREKVRENISRIVEKVTRYKQSISEDYLKKFREAEKLEERGKEFY